MNSGNPSTVVPPVWVMGAGSIGCYVGGLLAAAAQGGKVAAGVPAVTLIGRPRVLQAVGERGMALTAVDAAPQQVPPGALRLMAEPPACEGPAPLVLLAVKSGATADAAGQLARVLPAGSLVHTVETFNAQAAAGNDPLFHKAPDWLRPLTKAPFAAISYCSADLETHAFTLGGLATRPSGEVLDGDGQPIRGLFAAGRSACGLPRWGEGYSSGLSLGDSTFFGRMAGKSAAA